jgi:hypothetical protein
MAMNWILLSGVFFDLTQFNFHGLLFSQKKEDHPHHQNQNHRQDEYNNVSKEVHDVKTTAKGARQKALALEAGGAALWALRLEAKTHPTTLICCLKPLTSNLQHLFCQLNTSFVPLRQTEELVQIV